MQRAEKTCEVDRGCGFIHALAGLDKRKRGEVGVLLFEQSANEGDVNRRFCRRRHGSRVLGDDEILENSPGPEPQLRAALP